MAPSRRFAHLGSNLMRTAPLVKPRLYIGHRLLACSMLLWITHANVNAQPTPKYTNVERLSLARLAAVHDDVEKWKLQRSNIPPVPDLNDFRCILHAHAEDSTHTG